MNLYLEQKEKDKKLPKWHTVDGIKGLEDGIQGIHAMLVFTSSDLSKVIEITNKYKISKDAKVGNVSPIEVVLKAGATGMDSSQIELFQALKIQTKVIIHISKFLIII